MKNSRFSFRCAASALAFAAMSVATLDASAASCTSAPITQQLIWSPENGPHTLHEHFVVPAGTRLVITAGTEVRVATHKHILVQGELRVDGQSGSNVLFTSQNDTAEDRASAWDGIRIDSQGSAYIRHAVIRHAGLPVPVDLLPEFSAALSIRTPCAVQLIDSTVSDSRTTGVFVDGPAPVVPRLLNVKVINNAAHGLLVYQAAVDLRNSLLRGNGRDGLRNVHTFAYQGARTTVLDSDLMNNGAYGVYLMSDAAVPAQSQSLGHRNNIVDNGEGQIGVWYAYYLKSGKLLDDAGAEESLIDWTGNYFGDIVFENQCPWSTAPRYAPRGYLSFELQTDFCSEPPDGPVSFQTHVTQGPTDTCRVLYCGVNQVKVSPYSIWRFPRQ